MPENESESLFGKNILVVSIHKMFYEVSAWFIWAALII